MTRLALAVVLTATAGVAAAVTHHTRRPVQVQTMPPAPVPTLARASRGDTRTPLRAVPGGLVPTPRRHTPETSPTRRGALLDVTAYCATGSRTASGLRPQVGMAAGNRWPFGTRLRLVGYGDVVVQDRIGASSDVDVYLGADAGCEARALTFGRRHLRVVVER